MKRLLALSFVALVAFAPAAFANNSENQTGCHHGNSEQPCKDDPQPDKGNDCSNPSGGNQDHCATTSTTQPPSTTTSSAPTTTTTVTPESSSSTTSTLPVSVTTSTAPPRTCDALGMCPTTGGSGAATAAPSTVPSSTVLPSTSDPSPASQTTELAHTGWGSRLLLIVGLWLVAGGLFSMLLGWAIKDLGR